MRFPRGIEQDRLSKGAEFFGFPGKKHFADGFRARSPSRLAGLQDVNPGSPQALGEKRGLSSFPAPFAAFERDELALLSHELGFEMAGAAAAVGCGGFLRIFITACDT